MKQMHGVAIFFWIFEIAIDSGGAAFHRGSKLGEVTSENDQLQLLVNPLFCRESGDLRPLVDGPTMGRGSKLFEAGDQFPAEAIQLAERKQEAVRQITGQLTKLEGSAAEAPKLLAQFL